MSIPKVLEWIIETAVIFGFYVVFEGSTRKIDYGNGRFYHYIVVALTIIAGISASIFVGFIGMALLVGGYSVGALVLAISLIGLTIIIRHVYKKIYKRDNISRDRRRERIEKYKDTPIEKGIISLKHLKTDTNFLGISLDVNNELNDITYEQASSLTFSEEFSELWRKDGEEGFEFSVLKTLKCEKSKYKCIGELEKLLDETMVEVENSKKLEWL